MLWTRIVTNESATRKKQYYKQWEDAVYIDWNVYQMCDNELDIKSSGQKTGNYVNVTFR